MGDLFAGTHAPLLITDAATAETIKYASNAFLATKLSFVNAVAGLCEAVGADVRDVILGLGYDKRIGFEYLRPGPGWGGSCLPKDTRALVCIAEEAGYDFSFLRGAIATNDEQFVRVVDKVRAAVGDKLEGAVIAGLGAHLQGGHRRPAQLAGRRGGAAPGRGRGHRAGLRPDGAGARRPEVGPDRRAGRGRRRPTSRLGPGQAGAGLPRRLRRLRGSCRHRGAHRVGRVPLARLRQGAREPWPPRWWSTPATCSIRPSCAGSASSTPASVADERSPGGARAAGGSSGPTSATISSARGRRGGLRGRLLHRAAASNVAHLDGHPGFTLVEADISTSLPVDGAVSGVFNLASPASPPDYLARPLRDPGRRAAREPGGASSWPTGTGPGS